MKKKLLVVLSGFILLATCAYYSFFTVLYFLVGAIWCLVNFYFIQQLLYAILIENPKKIFKISMHALLKFPLLYGLGFVLLYTQEGFEWAMLLGFSAVLALGMQKRFWTVFLPNNKWIMT